MKALYIFLLVVGIILLLATNSELCLNNITGLAMMYVACRKKQDSSIKPESCFSIYTKLWILSVTGLIHIIMD